jgi:hypothetical protein
MQRSSTGVCAMDILLKQKLRQMDRGASRNLEIVWKVAEQGCSATVSMGAMDDVLAICARPPRRSVAEAYAHVRASSRRWNSWSTETNSIEMRRQYTPGNRIIAAKRL